MTRPELTYDPDSHSYFLGGQPIPGVTSVIRQQLAPLPPVNPELMQRAALFGSAVHSACELFDKATLDFSTLDDAVVPYVEGWRLFCKDIGWTVIHNEDIICSYKYRFAGTLDRIMGTDKGLALVDIKTGTTLSPAVGPQTAAYVIAAEEYLDVPTIKRRFCVQLMPNAYKLHQLKESMDSYTFIAALNNYNWRLKHGTA